MTYQEAKDRFIQQWGALGTSWGINRAMAQIQAVLLLATEPLSAEDIMEELGISRGNVSMSLKGLLEWGIVSKEYKHGDRKEYFVAEKDIYRMATQIADERRRRELEPVLHVLRLMQDVDSASAPANKVTEMKKVTSQMYEFAQKGDRFVKKFVSAERNWLFSKLLKW